MLPCPVISDADWDRVEDLLPGQARVGRRGQPPVRRRRSVDRPDRAPWRDLPEWLGNWNAAWLRFDRWSRKSTWKHVFEALQDPDLEWPVLDSTVIRARPRGRGKKSRR